MIRHSSSVPALIRRLARQGGGCEWPPSGSRRSSAISAEVSTITSVSRLVVTDDLFRTSGVRLGILAATNSCDARRSCGTARRCRARGAGAMASACASSRTICETPLPVAARISASSASASRFLMLIAMEYRTRAKFFTLYVFRPTRDKRVWMSGSDFAGEAPDAPSAPWHDRRRPRQPDRRQPPHRGADRRALGAGRRRLRHRPRARSDVRHRARARPAAFLWQLAADAGFRDRA